MKLIIVAGPPSVGKTAVIKHIIKHLHRKLKISFLKIDVVKAFEEEEIHRDFKDIPIKIVYSGDLCPDHAGVLVSRDAVDWAEENGSDILIIESAGLCLRCSPYMTQGLGLIVLAAVSGMNSPIKMGPMVSLADVAIVTKIDLISQAEKEVFREKIKSINDTLSILEINALQGTGMQRLVDMVLASGEIDKEKLQLRGIPPLGTCTICIGSKEIGWQKHFGVIRKLEGADYLYRGE